MVCARSRAGKPDSAHSQPQDCSIGTSTIQGPLPVLSMAVLPKLPCLIRFERVSSLLTGGGWRTVVKFVEKFQDCDGLVCTLAY
jgi:hypothetical protein